jgi:hypothetical protein
VNHPDVPRGRRLCRHVQITKRTVRRPLRAEDRRLDHDVARVEVDLRKGRRQDRHEIVVRTGPGEGGEVVCPVDRRAVVAIVRPGDDDGPNPRPAQPLELGGNPVDRTARLGVRIEQVAGDEEDVDLLRDRQVNRGLECGELPLALGRRGLAEVIMAGAEVDVRGVKQSEHPVAAGLPVPFGSEQRGEVDRPRCPRPAADFVRARRPLALARHLESRPPL